MGTPAQAAAFAAQLAERTRNLTPVYQATAQQISALTAAAYKDQRSPAGESWPKTQEGKPAHPGKPMPTIQVTGSGMRVGYPGHLEFHVKGTRTIPKRNPTPFEALPVGWKLIPLVADGHARRLALHVTGGR